MAQKMWVCDTCKKPSNTEPGTCPGCGKEACDHCSWTYAHCKDCCKGKTDEELRLAANAAGWDFEPEEPHAAAG